MKINEEDFASILEARGYSNAQITRAWGEAPVNISEDKLSEAAKQHKVFAFLRITQEGE